MSNQPTHHTQVAIIGSGVAGALCAYRLAAKGINVILLEAGPTVERSDIVENFRATAKQNLTSGYPNPDYAPRPEWVSQEDEFFGRVGPDNMQPEYLRVVGGTTWHWGGITPRLLPSDFEMKTKFGVGHNWPIDYATLEPYYAQAEREMGVCGDDDASTLSPRSTPYPLPPLAPAYSETVMLPFAEQAGLTFSATPSARNSRGYDGRSECQGFSTCSPICPSAAQYAAIVHVRKAQEHGAQLFDQALVDRLEIDDKGKVSVAHFRRPDGTRESISADVFVLGANCIESARILLMSAGEATPAGIANSSAQVGRNLFDHPGIDSTLVLKQPVFAGRGPETTRLAENFREGDFRSEHASWSFYFHNHLDFQIAAAEEIATGLKPPELDAHFKWKMERTISMSALIEQPPVEANGIRLDWSARDRAGQPKIDIQWQWGEYELAGAAHAKIYLEKIAKAAGAIEQTVTPLYGHHHLMGMIRMGENPKTSVTDAEGRTHDHSNLFAIGGAVFPTGGTANPTLTIAALSLRCADSIERQLKE
ncbi:MAG: choline dehydrogenase-like flavoprotein [Parvibaculaceae bacterium]|jgi:choline dehydrogenase-like flavoprotein